MDFEIVNITNEIYFLLFNKTITDAEEIEITNNRFIFLNTKKATKISNVLTLENAELFVKDYTKLVNHKFSNSKISKRVSATSIFPIDFIIISFKTLIYSSKNGIKVEIVDKSLMHKMSTNSFAFEFVDGNLSSVSFPEFDLNEII